MITSRRPNHPDASERPGIPLEYWVFDLDNTLYPASCSLFPQIDVRMRQFIAKALRLPPDEAFTLQKRYYHDYGTTLRGLMLVHGVEPDAFLNHVHDIDCGVLTPDPRLAAAVAALPGRRLIYTNGSERHAENVLNRLGMSELFHGIFDIRAAGFIPKPNAQAHRLMMKRHGVNPALAAMFEDIPRNLLPAAEAGMTTVWVREEGQNHWTDETNPGALGHVHHVTGDLAGWLKAWMETDKPDARS